MLEIFKQIFLIFSNVAQYFNRERLIKLGKKELEAEDLKKDNEELRKVIDIRERDNSSNDRLREPSKRKKNK